jgi:4-diphosphocytidyl-2-C-methyl-D-erythritol kinase
VKSNVIEVPSFAKVNLVLRVIGKRDDGFHEVFTVLQAVSLHDNIRFELNSSSITLRCDVPGMPLDNRNLIVRAAEALRLKYGVELGAYIYLDKRIPSPGGLGGGSSNAAVTLLALSRLWKIDASFDELSALAAELGADVPFFLHGGTGVGTGNGSAIENVKDIRLPGMIIVTPDVNVPTSMAYSLLSAPSLTNIEAESTLTNYRSGVADGIEPVNDLEKTVFAAFPEIERVKNALVELGAKQALMSGSGASVFGIFDNEETRQTALKALGERSNWRSFAVAAISRSDYREALAEVY